MQQRSVYSFVWSYTPEYFRGMCRERYDTDIPTLQGEVARLKAQLRQRDAGRYSQGRLAEDWRRSYEHTRSQYLRVQDEYRRALRELRDERARNRPVYRR